MSQAPAGWYPQPDGTQRYWDGNAWTEHIASPPVPAPASTAPSTATGTTAGYAYPTQSAAGANGGGAAAQAAPSRPWFKQKRFVIPGGIAALVIVGSVANAGNKAKDAAQPPQVAISVSSSAAPVQAKPVPTTTAPIVPAAPVTTTDAAVPTPTAEVTTPPPPPPAASPYDEAYGSFKPVTKSGKGDSVISLPAGAEAGIITITYKGSDFFSADTIDAANKMTLDTSVTSIGKYSGTTLFGMSSLGEPPKKLKISGNGSWSVTVAPISSAKKLAQTNSGNGDQVFLYDGEAANWALKHQGDGAFIVSADDGSFPDMLVMEIGNYSGTVPLGAGPLILEVKADGAWTMNRAAN